MPFIDGEFTGDGEEEEETFNADVVEDNVEIGEAAAIILLSSTTFAKASST